MYNNVPHDGDGELHVAFAIPSVELANWGLWLQTKGIEVEEKRMWELGGWSLYFRDPDRHLIELATPAYGRCIETTYRISVYQATWDLQSEPAERLAACVSGNNQKCELCIPLSGDMIPHEACQ
jgi:hypothetical protein